jgi:hypothetical protein
MPLLMVTPSNAQQTPDTGAVNQASPVTEKILKELRASQPDGDTTPAPVPTAETGPGTAAEPGPATPILLPTPDLPVPPAQDGSMAEPVTDGPAAVAPNTDGQLGAEQNAAPVDGDMAADGKLVSQPAEASKDPLADAPTVAARPEAQPVRMRPAAAPRRTARAVAGRSRRVADDDAPPPRRIRAAAPPSPSDAAVSDVAPDADAGPGDDAAPTLRPQIIAEDDDNPYAPVGYRIGSFKLMPSITAETVFSDNARQSRDNPQRDVSLVLRPAMTLESDWSRHFVSVDLRGMSSRHAQLSDENNNELNAAVSGRLDLREGTSLEGEAAYDLGRIAHSSPNLAEGAALRPSTSTATLGAAINHQVNRVGLRLHGSVADNDQGDSGSGKIAFRDTTVDARVAYELSPSFALVGTGKRLNRSYSDNSGTDAVANEARIGVETDPSALFSGVFSAGYARVTSSRPGSDGVNGFVGNANVIWLPSALTSLTFAASSDLGVTDATGATAVRTNKIGLDLTHDFRRWLSLTAGISETRRIYSGLELTEMERTGHIGLEYDLNRTVAITGDVKRTMLLSTDATKGYAENQVMVGLRLQK